MTFNKSINKWIKLIKKWRSRRVNGKEEVEKNCRALKSFGFGNTVKCATVAEPHRHEVALKNKKERKKSKKKIIREREIRRCNFFLFYFMFCFLFFFLFLHIHHHAPKKHQNKKNKWMKMKRRVQVIFSKKEDDAPTVIPPRLNLHLLICTTLSYGVLDISVQNVDRMCVWSVFVFTCGVKTNVIKLETVCVTALLYVQCSCPSFEKIEWNSLHKNHNK